MPELPEVEALAQFVRDRALGAVVGRVDVAAPGAVKTFDPPLDALSGHDITGAGRRGKFLVIDVGELRLAVHLARAGWMRWNEHPAAAPPKLGRGPLALRLHLFTPDATTPALDFTEQGTTKRLAVYLVTDLQQVPGIAALGPEALQLTEAELGAVLRSRSARIKNALTDQRLIAGIGNAYSDEILWAAKFSPYALTAKLTDEQVARLWAALHEILDAAIARSVGQEAANLKGEKKTGLHVHGRAGQACEVCGDTIAEVSFADKAFQYCPTCQTGGKPLADRRLSRLLK